MRALVIALLYLVCVVSLCGACSSGFECNFHEQCCHGNCIDASATCISGAAIAGIVIGCLFIGGIVVGVCLCFCCACGPFQNRSRGAVIQYGAPQTVTTTTGTTSYPAAPPQTTASYGTTYPQQPAPYPGQPVQYPQSGMMQGHAPYNQAPVYQGPPPGYDQANAPPPSYNPAYTNSK